jgi:hypothetical protein
VFKQDEENKRKNYKYKKEGRMEELGKRVLLTHFPPASTLSTQLSAQTNKYLIFYISSVFVLPSFNINKFFSRRVLPSQQGINRKGTVCVISFLPSILYLV